MLVFTILGFIAGVKTMIRSAAEVQRKELEKAATPNAAQTEDEG
jgi:ATP synthase protein I